MLPRLDAAMPPNKFVNSSGNWGCSSVNKPRWRSRTARLSPALKALGIDVREGRIGNVGTRTIVLEKVVILSSVSSAERLPSPETSQSKVFIADDIADDITIADDSTKNIVSNRTAEHERVLRFADDTDNKKSRSTSARSSVSI